MVKRTRPTRQPASPAPARPELNSEFANRLRDPFETTYMGVIESNDPLLMERGNAGVAIYRDLKRDGKVFDGLQKRQLALIGKAWQVEPREESETGTQDAETVNAILKACNFDKLCTDLLDALLTGFVVAEIVWTVRDNLVVPERVVKRAQRRFKYVQLGENSPPELHLLTRENMLTGEPVPERKFIVHRVNPEDDNPYGTGLGLQLYWPVFFKRKGVVAWNKLCDRFGSPTPHGKYPRGAGPKEKNTLADALRAMSNDGYLITPEGMDIALLESKLSGNVTTQQALCEYMDDWIGAVLTGQEARSSGGGALAAASKERADVRQDLTQADSDLLSETLNSTLLAWICELNDLVPCQVYRQIKQEEDLKSMAETDKIVSDMGFELSLDAVRARYGAGWDKKAPLATPAPTAAPGQAANFAEPGVEPADGTARLLGAATVPLMAGWLQQLQQLVDTHTDAATLQDALLSAYGHMPTAQLTDVMTLAFTLADLQGRDQVAQEQTGA
jgi:phage gp29-like protein